MDKKEERTGIVLNRMYVGDYLSLNLGHEVIIMFQADDNNHYLYLNAKGNFSSQGENVGTMLLVRGIGKGRVEVVGMAKNLQCVDGACCTLPRDLGKINTEARSAQDTALKNVKYGGVSIFDIFGAQGQQSVYASYWVTNKEFFVPNGKPLIIAFSNSDNKTDATVILENNNFASTSLHQFILEGEDLDRLKELCDVEKRTDIWRLDNTKLSKRNIRVKKRKISLFDICQIQNDENRFSNAMSYFIQQYPKLWQRLLQDKAGIKDLDEIESVTREEDAKVDNQKYKDKTGGRIDFLIRTKNYYIIIENKIDSKIIVEKNVTQLSRYYHYVKWLKEEQQNKLAEEKKRLEEELCGLQTKLTNPRNKRSEYRTDWIQSIDKCGKKLKAVESQIEEVKNRKIVGRVLTPNYNRQDSALLKVEYTDGDSKQVFCFEEITYGDVYEWLGKNANTELENDINFKAFYNAMKRHTYDHESKAMYQDMLEKFVQRIKEFNK